MNRVSLTCAVLLSFDMATAPAIAAEEQHAALHDTASGGTGFVGYVDSAAVAATPFEAWPGARARLLSADPAAGRVSWRVEVPAGWQLRRGARLPQSREIVMLEGTLKFGDDLLQRWDFAFVPPRARLPGLESSQGATLLLFQDPPAADRAAVERQRRRGSYVTRFDPARWQPAALARAAGATADLRVMHLKKDPFTTARTWYVKLDGGMTVPWEVHSMPEEGFVMTGRYRLAECLPSRTVTGEYSTGGYFWRPGGIPHSGPTSGPVENTVWLQRSPVALDVVFYGRCVAGTAAEPVAPSVAR